jgi:hypothetical protein
MASVSVLALDVVHHFLGLVHGLLVCSDLLADRIRFVRRSVRCLVYKGSCEAYVRQAKIDLSVGV